MNYTPKVEELLPDHKFKCSQPNCDAVFANKGNYELHLLKRHKISIAKDAATRLFHCPQSDCVKHFKNMKYLRQHFHKVHAAKTHICERCGKGFPTIGLLTSHAEKVCGRKFVCHECGWDYSTMEALLTHGRRKAHIIKDEQYAQEESELANVAANISFTRHRTQKRIKALDTSTQQHQFTQTEPPKRMCITGVQTDVTAIYPLNSTAIADSTELDDIHTLLRNIETQTDTAPFRSSPASNSNSVLIDQMLGQSSHMHTQTCDDFLTELGLTDIQTQTNWSTLSATEHKHQFASTATSTGCVHDELLVSTETQTSFTQCLLDSCHTTNTGVGSDSAFGGLYITQHTQTCDTLLDGLFGAQENDLIGGLQSAYTQT